MIDVKIMKRHEVEAGEEGRRNAKKCPGARAIFESDDDIVSVFVDRHITRVARESTGFVTTYRTAPAMSDYVVQWDNDETPTARPRIQIDEEVYKSRRERALNQRGKAEEVARRRATAAATGQDIRDVRPEDTSVFGEDGFANTSLSRDRVVKPKKSVVRPYARRETVS